MYYRTYRFVSPLFYIIVLNLIWSSKSMYTPQTNSLLGPSDHREAYFNGTTSYIRLQTTISLLKHTGLSFRTCIGGELFSQKYNENTISLSVTKSGLEFIVGTPSTVINTKIVAHLLDNKWHTVNLEYRVGNLTLSIDEESQLIANKTYNPELLTNTGLSNEGAILLVGKQFSGCILEGPSIVFNKSVIQPHDVLFGPCPIPTNSCAPRADIIQNRQAIVDYCLHEPCMRHGKCISRPDRYECKCSPRYSGKNCEVDNGPICLKHPCQNGATCKELDGSGDYECICLPGFTGKFCESELRIHQLCQKDPCLNNGTCRVLPGSNINDCICAPGYTGQYCETDINECNSNPCENGGHCVDAPNSYHCLCGHTGYEGVNCEININECLENPCLNHAVCFDTYGSYVCQCQDGYGGHDCDQNLNECVSMPCQNKGLCQDTIGGYECVCQPGFSGKNCELSLCENGVCAAYAECVGYRCVCKAGYTGIYPNCTETGVGCLSNPCLNGGTCTAYIDTFNCTCPLGFTGKFCQQTITLNECSSMPCQNGGECYNELDGFRCNCTKDFTGLLCEHPLDICGYNPCNNNGTCISKNKKDFTCNCLPGFTGKQCQHNIDECQHIQCPDGRVCKDLVAGYECSCPDGYTGENCQIQIPKNLCANYVCSNGGTCIVTKMGQVKCLCDSGYTGQYCETAIDECKRPDGTQTCVHGICHSRKEGGFQCYCQPGYTGETCSLDFDECLSQPCQHNSTCLNLVNNYQCNCRPGYAGKNCDEEINECDSSPCFEGSTCVDQVASFICVCQPGFTGHLCNINIDDCESSPCENGGLCIDGLNTYSCNCTDTGYNGLHCEHNIDDCLINPCENGAKCVDGVKDYFCDCFTGYAGKNCEIDINECDSSPCQNNGTCLQRSNLTLYEMVPKTGLPDIFSEKFTFENASGYECICIDGVQGKDCEIDINECDKFPCQKGSTCRNLIGGYSCECEEGTEGKHCEIEIDECLKYTPCENGICIDKKATYFCDCFPNYGGKNCSVLLTGCNKSPCLNNGTCKPYVENEYNHKFNCSCQNGFHGKQCEKITTMSFSGSSYIGVNTSREEGYDIEFRFKTTLGDGLIAIGQGPTFYFLELINGRLNLRSSLLNKWEGVFIGSELNNSNWQKVFVAINSSHLVLAANEEQTIYPINLNEGSNTSHTSFQTTYLGEPMEFKKSKLTHTQQAFVGCTQDLIINGEWVLPQNTSHVTHDIEVGCSRTPQCDPNPCHSGGRCTDKWRTFSCTCERPYLGHTCQYNYTAATFCYENITNSLVLVTVTDPARRAVRSIVDISMFIRTRQSVGQIFYLGSSLSGTNTNEDNHISAKLEGGELLVSILFNSTLESYTVSGVKLDNGFNHLIEVVRNISLVKVILNGTEYFRKTISGTGQLDAQVLYLGGLPEVKRPVRQTDLSGLRVDTTTTSSGISSAIISPTVNFKGIIQDVQVSNGTKRMVVQFYPLTDKELGIPPAFGKVSFDSSTLLEGVVSDDLCRFNPCEHNGNCTITWNDFKCECPKGYKGKTCSELEFCQLKKKDCPPGSVCNNLEDGYECVSNATFTGRTKPLQYIFESSSDYAIDFEQIFIKYRTKVGGTVMYVKNEEDYFFIFVHKDEVTVQWSLMGKIESHRFSKDNTNGDWNILIFRIKELMFYGGFKENVDDDNSNVVVNDFNTTAFDDLFTRGTIYLGGSDKRASHFLNLHYNYTRYNSSNYITNNSATESNSVEIQTATVSPEFVVNENLNIRDKFKGCLGEIRIGNLLLPFYTTSEMYTPNNILRDYFSLIEKNMDPYTNHTNGCKVCFEEDCKNNGRCAAPEQSYQCNCTAGYAADDCSINIDECEVNKCQNGATCVDGIANFTCECINGYEGWLCDTEIDECESSPCRNGGTCRDQLAAYVCICTDDYVGKQCEALRLITCENNPCRNGSTCTDGANLKTGNNFTCSCMKGMVGALCDTPYCVAEPCKHGECNTSVPEPFCHCDRGYTGHLCEEDIDDCILPTGDSPCLHDGQCTDEVDKYNCNCTGTGFKGLICEHDVDECEDDFICGDKGDCENTIGSFWCHCPPDLCGIRCALPNPCKMSPCGEHGTCNATCKTEATFRCDCEPGYYGTFCNETVVSQSASDDSINIALIIIPIVAILLLGGAAGLAVLIAMARSKRATRGTYSPSAQEFCNPRVELDHVLKPPPEERLI